MPQGLSLNWLAFGGDTDYIAGQLNNLILSSFLYQLDDVAHILFIDDLSLGSQGHQILNCLDGINDPLWVFICHFEYRVSAYCRNPHFMLDNADIFIKGAKDIDGLL